MQVSAGVGEAGRRPNSLAAEFAKLGVGCASFTHAAGLGVGSATQAAELGVGSDSFTKAAGLGVGSDSSTQAAELGVGSASFAEAAGLGVGSASSTQAAELGVGSASSTNQPARKKVAKSIEKQIHDAQKAKVKEAITAHRTLWLDFLCRHGYKMGRGFTIFPIFEDEGGDFCSDEPSETLEQLDRNPLWLAWKKCLKSHKTKQ